MKTHHFVTATSDLNNLVYRMLFTDGDEREILLPQPALFSVDRRPWSRSKEEVDEQLRLLGFHEPRLYRVSLLSAAARNAK